MLSVVYQSPCCLNSSTQERGSIRVYGNQSTTVPVSLPSRWVYYGVSLTNINDDSEYGCCNAEGGGAGVDGEVNLGNIPNHTKCFACGEMTVIQ